MPIDVPSLTIPLLRPQSRTGDVRRASLTYHPVGNFKVVLRTGPWRGQSPEIRLLLATAVAVEALLDQACDTAGTLNDGELNPPQQTSRTMWLQMQISSPGSIFPQICGRL